MSKTDIDDRIQSARSITLSPGLQTRNGKLTNTNADRLYNIRLKHTSTLHLNLAGRLKTQVGLQLLDRTGTVLQTSDLPRRQAESIHRNLKKGQYWVRVFAKAGQTRYQLSLAATPDRVGDRLQTARRLGNLGRHNLSNVTVQEWLGQGDRDYYQFQINDRRQVVFSLSHVTHPVRLQLFDRNGTRVQTAVANGTNSPAFPLKAGTYYLRLAPSPTPSPTSPMRYTLNATANPAAAPLPLPPIPPIRLASYTSGLNKPVHITHAGDGSNRLFVVQQTGQIQIVNNGVIAPTPFLDISDRVRSQGEEGLLSVAFSPNYSTNGQFYVYYTNVDGNNVIARFQRSTEINRADPNSEQRVLTIDHPTFSNHNGGQLAFGPDGYLYVGTGDGGGGGDPAQNAQNPSSLLGKLLRLDVESPGTTTYTIPATNPFVGDRDPQDLYRDEIWALGLRNPWRFSFDRQTENLYIADVGQNAYEEVNVQFASSSGGENYGWNAWEGAQPFNNTTPISTNVVFPVAGYDHTQGMSITGGYVYRGTAAPALQGVYFYGDFVNGKLWGLRQNGSVWDNQFLLDSPYGISTFGEDEQGNLYLADYFAGRMYTLTDAPLILDVIPPSIA